MAPDPALEPRIAEWTSAGLLTAEQGDSIRAFEASRAESATAAVPTSTVPSPAGSTPEAPELRDRLAGSVGVLGALLVGLGVLLSVAANWDSIGDTAKVLLICVSMLVAHGLGMRSDLRGAPRWAGTAGYLVGTLVFAGGVFLLGQTFNVSAHDPLGFLVVAITASCVTLLTGRLPVGWVAAAAWLAWAVHEFVASLGDVEDEAAGVALVASCVLLAIAVVGIGWVLDGVAERYERDDASVRGMLAELHLLGSPFRTLALASLLALLVPMSFAWHFGEEFGVAPPGFGQVALASAAVVASAALMFRVGAPRARVKVAVALLAAGALVLLVVVTNNLAVAGVAANLLLAGGGVALALLGLSEERRDAYAWGVTWIVALIVARYVDFMVSVSLGGIGFIGAGLLLLGCAWLIGRSRRLWKERDAT